ncbi:MAG TPA: hypothetical protein VM618_04220 [Acidimicrobiia bacterium]|nr:hypothetical protein [Acidimicrobiia bacterium]
MDVAVLVSDLMLRSKVQAAIPGARPIRDPAEAAGADAVVVDLGRHADAVAAVRAVSPAARIVAFASHVEREVLQRAEAEGADAVMPRSRFFADPAAAVAVTP